MQDTVISEGDSETKWIRNSHNVVVMRFIESPLTKYIVLITCIARLRGKGSHGLGH